MKPSSNVSGMELVDFLEEVRQYQTALKKRYLKDKKLSYVDDKLFKHYKTTCALQLLTAEKDSSLEEMERKQSCSFKESMPHLYNFYELNYRVNGLEKNYTRIKEMILLADISQPVEREQAIFFRSFLSFEKEYRQKIEQTKEELDRLNDSFKAFVCDMIKENNIFN